MSSNTDDASVLTTPVEAVDRAWPLKRERKGASDRVEGLSRRPGGNFASTRRSPHTVISGASMTLDGQLRRRVRRAIDAARSRGRNGASRVRIVDFANVVVARNIGAHSKTEASAHQTVVVRDGSIHARTERNVVNDSSSRSPEQGEWQK
jgi:hypothetical protein